MGEREGVIKFEVEHEPCTKRVRGQSDVAAQVVAWRDILARLALVGQDAGRYQGLGFGNVSARVPPWGKGPGHRAFLITGTQTGGRSCMSLSGLALVKAYDTRRGWVQSEGEVKPSSEAMTHAAVYDLAPHVRWVFHAHSPAIWSRAMRDPDGAGIPTTRPGVAYGTIEMADEIRRLWRGSALPDTRLLAMAGHEDGVVSFGRTASEAGQVLLDKLAECFSHTCREAGELCRV